MKINYKRPQPVISINPETGEETYYPSVKSAVEATGIQQAQISMACTWEHKAHGLYWRRVEK